MTVPILPTGVHLPGNPSSGKSFFFLVYQEVLYITEGSFLRYILNLSFEMEIMMLVGTFEITLGVVWVLASSRLNMVSQPRPCYRFIPSFCQRLHCLPLLFQFGVDWGCPDTGLACVSKSWELRECSCVRCCGPPPTCIISGAPARLVDVHHAPSLPGAGLCCGPPALSCAFVPTPVLIIQ